MNCFSCLLQCTWRARIPAGSGHVCDVQTHSRIIRKKCHQARWKHTCFDGRLLTTGCDAPPTGQTDTTQENSYFSQPFHYPHDQFSQSVFGRLRRGMLPGIDNILTLLRYSLSCHNRDSVSVDHLHVFVLLSRNWRRLQLESKDWR